MVLAVTMRANDLVGILRPRQVTHLAAGVDFLDHGSGRRVPEFNRSISRTSTGSEKMMLMRRPGYSLNGSNVIREAVQRRLVQLIPHHKFIIVSP